MGATNSTEIEGIRYKQKARGKTVAINFKEKFKYPKQPNDDEINIQLNEILKDLILSPNQMNEMENLPTSTKWKLICKHKHYIAFFIFLY